MRIITLDEIRSAIDHQSVIQAVRTSFIDHYKGIIKSPCPMQMVFGQNQNTISGDCHVKSAYAAQHSYFCIKIATGFYKNPDKGLPVNNGLLMLFCAQTGQPLALFQDQGHLTSIRTAAAGALAAGLAASTGSKRLGIVGTGHQAELQACWISAYMDISHITVFGRSTKKCQHLIERLGDIKVAVKTAISASELCALSDIIVTTTPSTSPILKSSDIKPGHHIVAIGADSAGKIELEVDILARADFIFTDDHDQCLKHGEFGHAVRSGLISDNKDVSLGHALSESSPTINLSNNTISIVDLTGIGAQDHAISQMVYKRL